MTTSKTARPDSQIPLRLDLHNSIVERAQKIREGLAHGRLLGERFKAIERRKEVLKERYRRLG